MATVYTFDVQPSAPVGGIPLQDLGIRINVPKWSDAPTNTVLNTYDLSAVGITPVDIQSSEMLATAISSGYIILKADGDTVVDPSSVPVTQLPGMVGATVSTDGVAGITPTPVAGDETKFLKGDGTWASLPGGGSVTSVSVATANGFLGTVATATSTPVISIKTGVTGILRGNSGTGVVDAAQAGTDFVAPNGSISAGTATKISYDPKGLVTAGGTAVLASADFSNQGTATTVLHGNASGNPSFSAVALGSDVSGTLPVANGGTGVTSSTGTGSVVLSNSPTLVAPVLGTPASGVATNLTGTASGLTAGTVTTNANLTGPVTSVGNATSVTSNAISNTMLAQVATSTLKGRSTALTGNVEDLTATQATAILDSMVGDSGSGGIKGLVPAPSTGDAIKFLRGDGTWQSNGSGTVTSVSVATANGVSGSVANSTSTPAISLTLGAITPSSVSASGSVTGSNLSGNNSGDQTITLTGAVTGSGTGSFATTLATVPATSGGTGQTNFTVGDILYASTTSALSKLSDVAAGSYLRSGGINTAPVWSNLTLPNTAGVGDLIQATATNAMTVLSAVATGNALISGGVGVVSAWGKIGLTTHVSGTLPVANGGTGVTSSTGTGSVVLSNSPTLVTPVLGTPASGVATNLTGTAAGLTAGTVTTNANLTGPITSIGNITSVTANAISNTMLSQVATATFKGRSTALTGNVEDLSASQATGILDVMVGDSGSGGIKGLVPAPATGDATKYLRGDGTWGTVSGGSGTVTSVSVTTANGVSGTVATATSTPAISLTLGAITPSSVAASGSVTGSNLSGNNSGDQTITLTGAVTGSGTGSFATTLATVPATSGGTGQTSYAVGDILYASTTSALSKLSDVAAGAYLRSGGVNTAPVWSTLLLPNTASTGDIIQATASNSMAVLSAVATGNVLLSGGVGVVSSWGKVGLSTHVSGVLPIANGGTNSSVALNNGRHIISSGGSLVETAAATNGQLLIGSTGVAPVLATITDGYGHSTTNGAGTITNAVSLTTTHTAGTTTLTTTSSTDVALSSSITGTPAAGEYLLMFSCSMGANTTTAALTTISLYTGASLGAATQVTGTERQVKNGAGGQGATITGSVSFQVPVTFTGTSVYEIRWRRSAGTSSIFHRQLTLLRIA